MKKAVLIQKIVARLAEGFRLLEQAARASHAEATHESSKAENKYDTRGLEAAYLAGGQARQAKELLDSLKVYEALAPAPFDANQPIALTALVDLEADGARALYFLGPRNGGLEIEHRGQSITVITPQSVLGQTLLGKKAGQRWTTKGNGTSVSYRVVAVS